MILPSIHSNIAEGGTNIFIFFPIPKYSAMLCVNANVSESPGPALPAMLVCVGSIRAHYLSKILVR